MAMFLVRYPQPESTHFVHPHAGHHRRLQHHGRCGDPGRATTRPFAGRCSANGADRCSPVNIKEDENIVELPLDVPGVKAGDLSVNVENHVLTISGQRAVSTPDNRTSNWQFSRQFALDTTVDTTNLSAALTNGVLTISAPKIAKPGPITITISEVPANDEVAPTTNAEDDSQMVAAVPVEETLYRHDDEDIVLVEATNEEESLEHDDAEE